MKYLLFPYIFEETYSRDERVESNAYIEVWEEANFPNNQQAL